MPKENREQWVTIIALLVPLFVALATIFANHLSNERSDRIKLMELDDSLDPTILAALLDPDKKESAIKLGNGLYIHAPRSDSTKRWWCNATKHIAPGNPDCEKWKTDK